MKAHPKKISYALSLFLLKPNSSQTISEHQINEKNYQALDKIKAENAKVTENGKILVYVPNKKI